MVDWPFSKTNSGGLDQSRHKMDTRWGKDRKDASAQNHDECKYLVLALCAYGRKKDQVVGRDVNNYTIAMGISGMTELKNAPSSQYFNDTIYIFSVYETIKK